MNLQTHRATPDLTDLYYKTMTQAISEALIMSQKFTDFFFYVRRSTTTGRPKVTILGDFISDEPILYTITKGEITL